MSTYLQTGMWY